MLLMQEVLGKHVQTEWSAPDGVFSIPLAPVLTFLSFMEGREVTASFWASLGNKSNPSE